MRFHAASVLALFLLAGCSGAASSDNTDQVGDDLRSDKCVTPARAAAEDAYGNDPSGESVKAIKKGVKYLVTVGKNNPEDGPEDFWVTFPSGCSSKPKAEPVPFAAHPLRDAAHTVYDNILWKHKDAIPSSYAVSTSDLPSAARTQYNTWKKDGSSTCTAVDAYEVYVSGQQTFAVTCNVANDSIQLSVAIWDSSGSDVDQASVYGSTDVGDNGISWQNETFEVTN